MDDALSPQPVVWIISADQWPRAALRAELIERGYDAVGFTRILEALAGLETPDAVRPRAIVLDLRDQTLSRALLDALMDTGVPVVLAGGAPELNDPVVAALPWASVLRRPYSLGQVADQVAAIVSTTRPETAAPA